MLDKEYGWVAANDMITHLAGQTVHGLKKGRTLYDLAYNAKGGAIVEVGVYHGIGQIALGYGTQFSEQHCPLYAVDDYLEKGGWIYGEHYEPEDKTKLLLNMGAAGLHFTLVQKECRVAGLTWEHGPIALLVWDVANFNRLQGDFDAWENRIMPGGIFTMRDIDNFRFGAKEVAQRAIDSGRWADMQEWPGFIVSVRAK